MDWFKSYKIINTAHLLNNWNRFPDTKPKKYGRYEVYLPGCDKQYYLTWNGKGWSSDGNAVKYWREVVNPMGKVMFQ